MLAVDFSKAFDSIAFSYIEAVLKFFNFSEKIIAWLKILLKDFTIVIIHGGNKSESVAIGRGCRQGDPIASLLFILCIEILLIKIRTANTVKPFKLAYNINPFKEVTINQYMEGFADDITLSI